MGNCTSKGEGLGAQIDTDEISASGTRGDMLLSEWRHRLYEWYPAREVLL